MSHLFIRRTLFFLSLLLPSWLLPAYAYPLGRLSSYANYNLGSDELTEKYGLSWGMSLQVIKDILRKDGFLQQPLLDNHTFFDRTFTNLDKGWHYAFSEGLHTRFSWSLAPGYRYSSKAKSQTIYSIFENSTTSYIIIVRVGSSLSEHPGLQRLYHYKENLSLEVFHPNIENYSNNMVVYHRLQYDDLNSIRRGASKPDRSLFSNETAPWISPLRTYFNNHETDKLWIDRSSDTIYRYESSASSSYKFMPDDHYYAVFAIDRDTLRLKHIFYYNIFGAEEIFIPADKLTLSGDFFLVIVFLCLAFFIYIIWLRVKTKKAESMQRLQREMTKWQEQGKARARKDRRFAFSQEMGKAEWLSETHSFDKAKIVLERLKTAYPEFSCEIEERRRRVMETQTNYFKNKTRDKTNKT